MATVTLQCADQRVEMTASYLHDSLRDLASAARALVGGAAEVRVLFMDEPGEHELILRRAGEDAVEVEVLWYDDWKSWKMHAGQGKRKLFGSTSVAHDSPAAEMRELEGAG